MRTPTASEAAGMRFWGGMAIVILVGSAYSTANAAPFLPSLDATTTPPPYSPVVVFGNDSRRTADDFAAEHHVDLAELRRDHSASGLIECGDAHGAGQLTMSSNVVTTAAHVFYDENGIARSRT